MRSALNRRKLLTTIGQAVGVAAASKPIIVMAQATAAPRKDHTMESWMDEWMSLYRDVVGALHVSRFADPTYFLTKPITWRPNPEQRAEYQPVKVPVGFVTDFASIPRVFWSILRPDGVYTYPAIIHDYLYWTQMYSRETADSILKFGMEDFSIETATIATIYSAVRLGGLTAWENNASLKQMGERRVLRRFPEDPRTKWADWKKLADVFEP
jgi:hypothetical protein